MAFFSVAYAFFKSIAISISIEINFFGQTNSKLLKRFLFKKSSPIPKEVESNVVFKYVDSIGWILTEILRKLVLLFPHSLSKGPTFLLVLLIFAKISIAIHFHGHKSSSDSLNVGYFKTSEFIYHQFLGKNNVVCYTVTETGYLKINNKQIVRPKLAARVRIRADGRISVRNHKLWDQKNV